MEKNVVTDMTQSRQELLDRLHAKYAATLDDKLAKLKEIVDILVTGKPNSDNTAALTELMSEAHKIAGSAGTYGFADLGDAARELELYCQAISETSSLRSLVDQEKIASLVAKILLCHSKPSQQ